VNRQLTPAEDVIGAVLECINTLQILQRLADHPNAEVPFTDNIGSALAAIEPLRPLLVELLMAGSADLDSALWGAGKTIVDTSDLEMALEVVKPLAGLFSEEQRDSGSYARLANAVLEPQRRVGVRTLRPTRGQRGASDV
jgi:hypothetical protein